ncbi:MAG TPA: hypothetical protein PLJ00_05800 [Chitinophagales bacterium]|nr:hypothetical protein [Chitinophagales bacterium]
MQLIKPNQVMIKTDRKVNNIFHKLDSGLILVTSWNPEEHAVITGEVVMLSALRYSRKGVARHGGGGAAIEYKNTVCELKPGDKVYYRYNAAKSAYQSVAMRWVDENNENDYVIINYDEIFCKIENDVPVPINGWIIMEQILDSKSQHEVEAWGGKMLLPKDFKVQYHRYNCKVLYTPKNQIEEYFWDRAYGPTIGFVKPGDTALVTISYDLENSVAKTYDWQLVRVEERAILGKYDENGNVILNKRKVGLRLQEYSASDYIQVMERSKPFYKADVAMWCPFDRDFIDSFKAATDELDDPVAVVKKGTIGVEIEVNGEKIFVIDFDSILFFAERNIDIQLTPKQISQLQRAEHKKQEMKPDPKKIIIEP